jgi:hypothetical protein
LSVRGLAANLLLSLAAILFALLVGEAFVRLFTRTPPALLVTDPVVGKRFLPGFAGRVYVAECGCEVDLRFDREGLRGPDRPYAKPAGVKRVALVGDSMVAAVATVEERTLARRLEALLAASAAPTKWEVLNTGVSSSSTGSELALYRAVLQRYAPDVVVLVFWAGNDLADNSYELTRAPRLYFDLDPSGRLRQRPFAARTSALSAWLDLSSRLYVWQKAAVGQTLAGLRTARGLEPVELVYADPEPAPVARAWAITAALLRAFREETAARGTALALVLAPAASELYDDLWSELDERARRSGVRVERRHPDVRLRGLAEQAGIPFLSLAPAFAAAAPHRDSRLAREQLFYEGRYHWNDAGNALAANAVHDLVRAALQSVP